MADLETDIHKGYGFGLIFLDPKDLSDAFVFDLITIRPDKDLLVRFSNYFIETYLSKDATYPPRM